MKKNENSFTGSSIIQFLSALTKSELREFDKFIRSPFHNNRNDVVKYFTELRKFYPHFNNANFSREYIYAQLYPNSKYRDDVIRRLSSNLLKAGEEFGSYIMFRRDNFAFNRYLSGYYISKPAKKLLSRQLQKTESDLERSSSRDATYFLETNFLEELKRMAEVRSDSSGKKIDVQNQIDSVWKYAAITLFRLYKIANVHTRQFEKNYNLDNINLLFKFIDENGFMGSKALEIWYLLVKFSSEKQNDETFFKLKQMIKQNSEIFQPVESFMIYVSLLGYCFEKNIDPAADFSKDEFELMYEMLKGGFMIQDGIFHPEWFIYACITSLRAGKLQFAADFIEQYGKQLPPTEAKNVLNHAYAEYEIEKGNFESALKLLAVTKHDNVAQKLRANHMYIKIYFELGMNEQFFYNIDSFRHLMRNEASLSKEVKQIRENFIKYTVKLFKIKLKESAEDPKSIKAEILRTPIMGNKWLLKKLEELEKIQRKK